ncbi:MAG: ABC transporter ATP-binding protein [Polyangiaceae bacterium]
MSVVLEIADVVKRYAGRLVLDRATFRFEGPGVLVVRGDNGAGKSTLLSIVAGALSADAGRVAVCGRDLGADRVGALRKLGYAPDRMELPLELTTFELLSLVAALKGVAPPGDAWIDRIGARSFLGDRLGALSLGQRRRAVLLAALTGDPSLLVLDEPTNGLDLAGLAMLRALLRERTEQGHSTVLATHDAVFAAEVADARVELSEGRLHATEEHK